MMFRALACLAPLSVLAGLWAVSPVGAAAETHRGTGLCQAGTTDDQLRPLPPALVSRARKVFGLSMPDDLVQKSTVYRCLDGRTLLCTAGANLVCGKANTRPNLPAVTGWCRDNPQADNVPMYVTGHDTIYRWHCADGKPVRAGTVATVDSRGFLSTNWKDAGD